MPENNELTYVIFATDELQKINFEQVLQTSAETCRKSINGSKTLVKWYTVDGVPSCVQTLNSKGPYLTHSQILEIMSTPEWSEPIDPENP